MKKAVFIIALFIFIKPIVPVLDYIINYDYISNELCQNKETPVLACDGKCYLMSQLAKSSEDEKPISNDKKDNSKFEIQTLFFQPITELTSWHNYSSVKSITLDYYANLYFYNNSCSVFHPPKFIS